jgi:hypothetical protein
VSGKQNHERTTGNVSSQPHFHRTPEIQPYGTVSYLLPFALEEPVRLEMTAQLNQLLADTMPLRERAIEIGDDGSNDFLISEVLRTNELQVWFLSVHLVKVFLVEVREPSSGAGAA